MRPSPCDLTFILYTHRIDLFQGLYIGLEGSKDIYIDIQFEHDAIQPHEQFNMRCR